MLCRPRPVGLRLGTDKKRLRRSNVEGDRAMFQLIANRLLRQFQRYNLQHANELFSGFGQWAAFASRAAGRTLNPHDAALDRCRQVAAGVKRIAARCPPDLPYLGAWFVDTHVPLLLSAKAGKCKSIYDVYRNSLAPEQQAAFPIAVGPPFQPLSTLKAALQAAWFPTGGQAFSMLSKLLEKGTKPPVSIRYIGPQCIRALAENETGKLAMTAMIVAGELKAYPHSRAFDIMWDVNKRAEVYTRTSPEDVKNAINAKSARQLFAAVCEYIVALTSQHPSLWRAVSCAPGGLTHIRNVQHDATYRPRCRSSRGSRALAKRKQGGIAAAPNTEPGATKSSKKSAARSKIPSEITQRCDPKRLRAALLATTIDDTMLAEPALTRQEAVNLRIFASRHQAPLLMVKLPDHAAKLQREAVKQTSGSEQLFVTVCRTCSVIHRRIKGAPAPIKKRSGISVCVPVDDEQPGDLVTAVHTPASTRGECAACGTKASGIIVDAVGLEIRARVRHSDADCVTIMVCASCGALANNTIDLNGAPRCEQCAASLRCSPWPNGVTRLCICGAPAVNPQLPTSGAHATPVLISVQTSYNATKLLPVCPKHTGVAKHIPPGGSVPAKWLRELFRTRTPRVRHKASSSRRRLKQYTSARKFSFTSNNGYAQ